MCRSLASSTSHLRTRWLFSLASSMSSQDEALVEFRFELGPLDNSWSN